MLRGRNVSHGALERVNLPGINLKISLTELIEVVWLTFAPWLNPRLYDFYGLQKLKVYEFIVYK